MNASIKPTDIFNMKQKGVFLYHGSSVVVEYPQIRKFKYTKDFSWGFYCTENREQAIKRAKKHKSSSIVSKYLYIENSDLKILKFDDINDDWLDFIAKCRGGHVHEYDIVEGAMADDVVWDYVQDYISGDITRSAFFELIKFKYPTHQVSFHSLRALDCLTFEGSEQI